MITITSVSAREILDSRGNPTVQAEVTLSDGTVGVAGVPSGASTGSKEAVELRDGDPRRFGGKGVLNAVANVNGPISKAAIGRAAYDQAGLDAALVALDGSPNKSKLGANALLGVSMSVLRASALSMKLPLYRRIAELAGAKADELPVPMFNVLNGGAHAEGSTDFQEFMLYPTGLKSFPDALRAGSEVYQRLKRILHDEHLATTVGDEGGFAPAGINTRRALELLAKAVEGAGYQLGSEIAIALDPAATEFFKGGKYRLQRENRVLSTGEMVDEYATLCGMFPILSVEDGLAEDDWKGWTSITGRLGDRVQLVGDDLFVTQERFVREGLERKAGNAVLVKLNQVGTVSETIATVKLAQSYGWGTVISHRSGETEDTTIADLAVGLRAGQIKTGAPARSERTSKYNRLLRISEELGSGASYAGGRVLRRR
ncbi:MAG: phosphopyruvate hydratase [SAR202 cluster bacterium]|nr:phosphopyruvate hydratase [SAR202 cluster bacterium]